MFCILATESNSNLGSMNNTHSLFQSKQTLNCKGKIIDLSSPIIMGIINVTSDSFYSGSQFMMKWRIHKRAKQIIAQGGSIIDVGACSTRPGTKLTSENDELKRLTKAVKIIRKNIPNAIISVDTFRSSIARHMVEDFSVDIINDISAGDMDSKMFSTVAKLGVPYVLMHMQGTPTDMQINPQYKNVTHELFQFFSLKVEQLKQMGVNDIIIDPGFGFGKTIDHNYTILNNLDSFKLFNLPILVGLSRKSMIYKPLGIKPEQALNGSSILNVLALQKGAKILRVHDVLEADQTVKLHKLTIANSSSI
jgi:dihydropteroate synthase